MKSVQTAIAAILVLGNAVVWRGAFAPDRRFDFAGFADRLRTICPAARFESVQFEDRSLLPDDHAFFTSSEAAEAWCTVYVGYYPRQGLLEEEAHDPLVCYQAQGYRIVDGPREAAMGGITVARLTVEQDGDQRVAVYWCQETHQSTAPHGSARWWRRLATGRSDLAWIRVEIEPIGTGTDLSVDWRRRILAIADAVRASMPR
jgi:EpsI family protein